MITSIHPLSPNSLQMIFIIQVYTEFDLLLLTFKNLIYETQMNNYIFQLKVATMYDRYFSTVTYDEHLTAKFDMFQQIDLPEKIRKNIH